MSLVITVKGPSSSAVSGTRQVKLRPPKSRSCKTLAKPTVGKNTVGRWHQHAHPSGCDTADDRGGRRPLPGSCCRPQVQVEQQIPQTCSTASLGGRASLPVWATLWWAMVQRDAECRHHHAAGCTLCLTCIECTAVDDSFCNNVTLP
jgi:hypothetical protein